MGVFSAIGATIGNIPYNQRKEALKYYPSIGGSCVDRSAWAESHGENIIGCTFGILVGIISGCYIASLVDDHVRKFCMRKYLEKEQDKYFNAVASHPKQ